MVFTYNLPYKNQPTVGTWKPWVISPCDLQNRPTSGKPLLVGDPHLSIRNLEKLLTSRSKSKDNQPVARWWQLKYVFFHPEIWEDEPILTSIFFKWVETTN